MIIITCSIFSEPLKPGPMFCSDRYSFSSSAFLPSVFPTSHLRQPTARRGYPMAHRSSVTAHPPKVNPVATLTSISLPASRCHCYGAVRLLCTPPRRLLGTSAVFAPGASECASVGERPRRAPLHQSYGFRAKYLPPPFRTATVVYR